MIKETDFKHLRPGDLICSEFEDITTITLIVAKDESYNGEGYFNSRMLKGTYQLVLFDGEKLYGRKAFSYTRYRVIK
jgi:hypothetical protein